jgi:hypothetical protein
MAPFRFTDSTMILKSTNIMFLLTMTYKYTLVPEAYSCITNVKNGISFGGLYKLYLVDCENNIPQLI